MQISTSSVIEHPAVPFAEVEVDPSCFCRCGRCAGGNHCLREDRS